MAARSVLRISSLLNRRACVDGISQCRALAGTQYAYRLMHTSSPALGVITFKLADIGEGIAEVELLKNYKNVGDEIEEMEGVCEVQSDKAAVEITSRYTGKVVKVYHKEGEIVKIGGPLLDIETEGGESHAPSKHDKKEEDKAAPKAAAAAPKAAKADEEEVAAAPAVRRLAKELGVDLANVTGSGKGGRITKEDVEAAKAAGATPKAAAPAKATATVGAQAPAAPAAVKPVFLKPTETVQVPLKGYGRAMAKSMTDSLKVPHMNLGEEIDLTDLMEMRGSLKALLEKTGQKVTITPFIIKALSVALTKYPIMNSKFDGVTGDKYTMFGAHNISIAIDTPNGLVVPSIKNVESLSVLEIQGELTRLMHLAQANKLSTADLTGGTISVSNVGVIGGTYVKAILFDGQSCIIALGRVMMKPRYDEKNTLQPRSTMNVAISADHRHIDGATAARFATEFKSALENPGQMLLHLR